MYAHARSGLNLTLFRAYDPSLARWLSRDPIGEAAGLNLYAYVGNNPIGFIDPLGLKTYSNTYPYNIGPSDNRQAVYPYNSSKPVTAIGLKSGDYNCHSYSLGNNTGWNSNPGEILSSKYTEVTPGSALRVGDRIAYYNNGEITHTGIVSKVDAIGYATEIWSKLGANELVRHQPLDLQLMYGPNYVSQPGTTNYGDTIRFFRQK